MSEPQERAELSVDYRDPRQLKAYERNAREHPPEQVEQIAASILEFGFNNPVALREDEETIGAGHGRVEAAILLLDRGDRLPTPDGVSIPTITLRGLTDVQWRAYVLADNRLAEGASWNFDTLKIELGELAGLGLDIGLTGFSLEGLGDLGLPPGGKSGSGGQSNPGALAERFGIVPFSVLNAREGWWQDRKRAWLALGIQSEIGRGENLLKMSETVLEPDPEKRAAKKSAQTASLKGGLAFGTTIHPYDGQEGGAASAAGTSIFDPVLAELAYRWWSPPGGMILDPFAGGSVRGIVAGRLGRSYLGVDLRPEQIEANRAQARQILRADDGHVAWVEGDSRELPKLLDKGDKADFIFSCPPYADLERYSDDPRDLSTLEYGEFRKAYAEIIAAAAARLRNDRFAAFVVGEVRGPEGNYLGLVPDTIAAFEKAGLRFYNEAILVTSAGSLAMRAGRGFEVTRKLGKTHQNVLVFLKGDARKATKAIGAVEFGLIEENDEGADIRQNPARSGENREDPRAAAQGESTKYGERLLSLGGEV